MARRGEKRTREEPSLGQVMDACAQGAAQATQPRGRGQVARARNQAERSTADPLAIIPELWREQALPNLQRAGEGIQMMGEDTGRILDAYIRAYGPEILATIGSTFAGQEGPRAGRVPLARHNPSPPLHLRPLESLGGSSYSDRRQQMREQGSAQAAQARDARMAEHEALRQRLAEVLALSASPVQVTPSPGPDPGALAEAEAVLARARQRRGR